MEVFDFFDDDEIPSLSLETCPAARVRSAPTTRKACFTVPGPTGTLLKGWQLAMSDIEARVEKALLVVRRLLDTARNPERADNVPHSYDDKYLLAELMVRAGVASSLQSLTTAGL